jgi:hypothetical protein
MLICNSSFFVQYLPTEFANKYIRGKILSSFRLLGEKSGFAGALQEMVQFHLRQSARDGVHFVGTTI